MEGRDYLVGGKNPLQALMAPSPVLVVIDLGGAFFLCFFPERAHLSGLGFLVAAVFLDELQVA